MALYVVPVEAPALGMDWQAVVPGQYLWNVTGVTAVLATGGGLPSVAVDSSGNGNDGTYDNSTPGDITYGVAGLVAGDAAIQVQTSLGSNGAVRAPVALDIGTDGGTLQIWASPLPTAANRQIITLYDATLTLFFTFEIQSAGAGNYTMRCVWTVGGGFNSKSRTAAIAAGAHMFTMAYDAAVPEIQFYVDDLPFGAAVAVTGSLPIEALDWVDIGDAVGNAVTYDEAMITDGALGAADIALIYSKAAISFADYETTMIAMAPLNYYHLDDVVAGGGRQVDLVVRDGTNTVLEIPTGFALPSSSGPFTYSWQPTLRTSTQTPSSDQISVAIPRLILPAGYTIGTRTLDIEAGDQWSDINVWWDSNVQDAGRPIDPYAYPPGALLTYQGPRNRP